MTDVFLTIVNMGISAGWLVVAVMLIRLLLKKAPKWITVLLWGVVALRLLCPLSIESVMSLIPSAETISPTIMLDSEPAIDSGVPIINDAVNPLITDTFTPSPAESANPLQIWIPILAIVWLVGIAVLLGYTAVSYWRLHRRVATAVRLRDNIYQSEQVASPFVLGIIRPRIYLPFAIAEGDMAYVISHEQAHLRRRDHWWKPFGFLLLTVYWFHPLMWVGYVLLCRDIELACDEQVVKELDTLQRADYSQALLTCSVNRRSIAACPLAFGEVGVKDRVKSVLSYKKPAFWLVIAAVVSLVAVAVCFLTDPVGTDPQSRLLAVMDSKEPFIDPQGTQRYFKDYLCSNMYTTAPQWYTFVDCNSDGTDELVVRATPVSSSYMIFGIGDEGVCSYECGLDLSAIKQDGTFKKAGNDIYEPDVTMYYKFEFDGKSFKLVLDASVFASQGSYRIGSNDVSLQQMTRYMTAYSGKPPAVWTHCDNSFSTALVERYLAFLGGSEPAADAEGNELTVNAFMHDDTLGEDYTYTYCDMSGDGVPELCIDKKLEKYIFTQRDGKLYHWYTAPAAYTTLLNNGALLYERHGGAPEHVNYTYYELDKDGEVRFTIDFSRWEEEIFNGVKQPAYYEINGKQVSARVYERKVNKYLQIGNDRIVWYDRNGNGQTAQMKLNEERDFLRGVIRNNVTFVTKDGGKHLLNEYVTAGGSTFSAQQYTYLDFESDGVEELVVYGNGTYMVFHPEGDKIWGFELGQRDMISLKQDGTFIRSSGNGVNTYAGIYFAARGMVFDELAYMDEEAQQYRIHGTASTQQYVREYMMAFHQKPDAVWIGRLATSNVATGKHNGKTVTATYAVTDLPYPWDMRTIPTVNGYAHIYDYSQYGNHAYAGDTWNALDSRGERVFEVPYRQLSYFGEDGVAVAQRQDGDYVSVTTAGKETPITAEEFERLYRQINEHNEPDKARPTGYPEGALQGESNLYGDLALYVLPSTDGTYLIGVTDAAGNIVIPAYIRTEYVPTAETLCFDEGVAYVRDALSGRLGRITVTTS